MVIAGIFKRLKYKCGRCNKIVNSVNNSNTRKCVSCDTNMCHECYTGSGRGLVCDPCQEWVISRMVVPLEGYRKNFKKNDMLIRYVCKNWQKKKISGMIGLHSYCRGVENLGFLNSSFKFPCLRTFLIDRIFVRPS